MKKRLFYLLIFLYAALSPSALPAQTGTFRAVGNPEEIAAMIKGQSKAIQSIQSKFIQKKQLRYLDETIISKGKFWFKKENNLRWAYEEPFEYVIILHDGYFQIRDGEQVSSYDIESNAAFREINDLIIGMVQGKILEEKKFSMSAYEDGSRYQIRLVPLDPKVKEVVSDMEIYFDKLTLMVLKIVMKESELDYTEITFIDRKVNESIPDSLFFTGS